MSDNDRGAAPDPQGAALDPNAGGIEAGVNTSGAGGAELSGGSILAPDRGEAALGAGQSPAPREDYELNAALGQGEVDPALLAGMSEAMHQSGLSKAQAQGLAGAYQTHVEAARQAAVEAHQRDVAEAEKSLSPEEKELCRRGFRFLELSRAEAAVIEMHWGVRKAASMFAKIGRALREDKAPLGNGGDDSAGSPQAARARIAELQADPSFCQRYMNGEDSAVQRMTELFRKAAGGA